jgi:radical SAM superfamily enzyme YgiQ (UPF0313 family)
MKVIIVTIHLEPSTRAVPLAAACLKAEVPEHEVLLLNAYLGEDWEKKAEEIAALEPELVGLSVYLWNRSSALDLIGHLKRLRPELPLVAGGPEVTAAPDAFLKESGITAVMEGEGEPMMSPLLKALEEKTVLPEIPGLRTASYTPPRPAFCADLNALRSPILSGALSLGDNPGLLWELSRGCPFACSFCFESKGASLVRGFSLERIRKELETIAQAGIEQVFVLDPTFNVDRERVLTLLSWIRELTPGTYYYFEARSEFIDEETAEAFASVPCTLQIGLQSSSKRVLKNINRSFDPLKFSEKMALLGEAGVSFGLDLIYGLPGDSLEGFRDSLNYSLSQEPNHLDIFPLAVLPGTVLYDRREEFGLISDKGDPYLVRETETFPPEDMAQAAALSRACDALYNRGRGISWFSRVVYDLARSPVELLESWEEEATANSFLERVYKGRRPELAPVIMDLMSFLEQLEKIERAAPAMTPHGEVRLDPGTGVSLQDSAVLHLYHLHPELVTNGFPGATEDLAAHAGEFRTILWNREGEIGAEILSPEEWALLVRLEKGTVRLGELSGLMEESELTSVLMNGILEGYIVLTD